MKSITGFAFFLILVTPVLAQQERSEVNSPSEKQSIFDRLQKENIKSVQLEVDLDSLLNSKRLEPELPAILSFMGPEDNEVFLDLKVNVRGKYRRRVCDFPPLKLDFSKKDLEKEGLQRVDEFKLVTHCLNEKKSIDNIFKEYLAYQIYRILAPDASYRTYLFKIRYKDVKSNKKIDSYAILLEDEKELENRLGGEVCKGCYNYPDSLFDRQEVFVHDLFQFMIGNEDWSRAHLRNLELIRPPGGENTLLIPYDFDFSGLVDAPYSIPNSDLGLTDCRQRKFIGLAKSREEMSETIQLFKMKKEEIFDYVLRFELLAKSDRKQAINYLESFYECLDQDDFMERIIEAPKR